LNYINILCQNSLFFLHNSIEIAITHILLNTYLDFIHEKIHFFPGLKDILCEIPLTFFSPWTWWVQFFQLCRQIVLSFIEPILLSLTNFFPSLLTLASTLSISPAKISSNSATSFSALLFLGGRHRFLGLMLFLLAFVAFAFFNVLI